MKFFTKFWKDASTGKSRNVESITELSTAECLEYFSEQGGVNKTLVEQQKYVVKCMGERAASLNALDLDTEINKELIRKSAFSKYGTSEIDLSLESSMWFPRLKNKVLDKKFNQTGDDSDSVHSFGSDISIDGFAGPFSWETRSLQEMDFPPTPLGERKLTALHRQSFLNDDNNNVSDLFDIQDILKQNNKKNKQKMKNRYENKDGGENNNTHRNYETIDELRARLMKNYKEAKKQREIYLNVSSKNSDPNSSINGFRTKKNQQPVFRNYKVLPEETKEKSEGVVKFASEPEVVYMEKTNNRLSFSDELSSAIQRQGESISTSIDGVYENRSGSKASEIRGGDPTYMQSFSNCSNISNLSMKSDKNPNCEVFELTSGTDVINSPTKNNEKNTTQTKKDKHSPKQSNGKNAVKVESSLPSSPSANENLSRKNSLKNILKRSDSNNASSMKRRNSKSKEKNEIITRQDVENVLQNKHSRDSLYDNTEDTDSNGLSNVMDMLANW